MTCMALWSLVAISPALVASARTREPAHLGEFLWGLAGEESGWNYFIENPYSGAFGKYQIMPFNWDPWTSRTSARAGPTGRRANQEVVARAQGARPLLLAGLMASRRLLVADRGHRPAQEALVAGRQALRSQRALADGPSAAWPRPVQAGQPSPRHWVAARGSPPGDQRSHLVMHRSPGHQAHRGHVHSMSSLKILTPASRSRDITRSGSRRRTRRASAAGSRSRRTYPRAPRPLASGRARRRVPPAQPPRISPRLGATARRWRAARRRWWSSRFASTAGSSASSPWRTGTDRIDGGRPRRPGHLALDGRVDRYAGARRSTYLAQERFRDEGTQLPFVTDRPGDRRGDRQQPLPRHRPRTTPWRSATRGSCRRGSGAAPTSRRSCSS